MKSVKTIMPQEIEVWYIIPSLRKELTKIFVKDYKIKQKECANILGITEAAVSQYLKSKRANEISFSKKELGLIKKRAEMILKNKNENYMKNLYELCNELKGSKTICKFHKNQDSSIPKNCKICFKKT